MVESVLILGYNTRYIACSARKAGYKVYSVSHYDDLDLLNCVESLATFDDMPENAEPWLRKYEVDHIVLGSGFEDANIKPSLVLGNDPKIVKKVANKLWLAEKLDKMGISHPRTMDNNEIRFPCMAKPVRGGGGIKNVIVESESMLPQEDGYFFQEYLEGMPLSVSVLSTRSEAMPIAVNEIMVGKRWLGQCRPFGYCGNATPYATKYKEQMFDIARKLIPELGLVGSNGIDFIVNKDGPHVLEVNARFQGSLDSVELATGQNLFKAHVDAINGKLTEMKIKQFGIKGILFAKRRTLITGSMLAPMVADVPKPGKIYETGEAIVSVMGHGHTRGDAVRMMKDRYRFVKKNVKTFKNE
jgi:predicted ATP-grasp superfamily ATP-dependent carboligase